MDHFNFKHERPNENSLIIALCVFFCKKWISITQIIKIMNKNKNVDHFNFKHERLNKNSLIIALCMTYLDILFLLKQWININTIKDVDHFNINHVRLNRNRNMDHFNFKHERLNKNSLILTLCFSYLDFWLFFKQWININYNESCGPFQFQAW